MAKKKDNFRTDFCSVLGKYARAVVTEESLDIYIVGTFKIMACLISLAVVGLVLSLFFNSVLLMTFLTVGGGALGFFIGTKLLKGKRKHRFCYSDVTSFISEKGDLLISDKDNKLFYLKALPQKQQRILDGIELILWDNEEFKATRHGNILKINADEEIAE